MNNRRIVTVTVDPGRKVVLVKGWPAKDLLLTLGLKPLWSASGRGWCVDAKHAPDIEALGQREHLIVVPREVGGAP